MSVEVERLIATLEARVDKFEKALVRSYRESDRNFGKIENRADLMTRRLEASMGAASMKAVKFGASLAAGFAGGFAYGGVQEIVTSIAQVASGVAAVGDQARRAGVDVESFQALKYVAEQNRIGVDALTDGLKELNLRADEFILTGGGSGAEAFRRLGYSAEELSEKLKTPDLLFTEIIGKLGELDRAAQIRIADEIFGGSGGEQFVQLIEQGRGEIEKTIQEAKDLGIVMDQELIERAAELDRRFNTLANTVGSVLKSAIVDAASALQLFIDKFNATSAQQASTLDERMRELGLQRLQIENAKLEALGGPVPRGNTWEADLADISRQEREILAELEARRPIVVPAPRVDGVEGGPGLYDNFLDDFGVKKPKATGGGRGSATTEADRQAKAIQNVIAGLQFEREMLGLNALEQETLTNLRKAMTDETTKEGQQIVLLTEQLYNEQQAIQQMTDLWQALGDVGRSAFEGIVDAMADGKVEGEEWKAILSDLLRQSARFLLNMGMNAIGGAFNLPGFANGTNNAPGGLATINERGGEIVNLPSGAQVIPHDISMEMARVMGRGTGNVGGFTFAPVIDARGADAAGLARVETQLRRMQAELPSVVKRTMRDVKRYGQG